MNKTICIITLLLLVFCPIQGQVQVKNQRERSGFRGPVHSSRLEKILLTEGGKQEKSREVIDEVTFDERGHVVFIDSSHEHSNKLVNSFDAKGRIIKTAIYEADGSLNRHQVYSYNDRERILKEEWQHANGTVFRETVYTYNSRGLLAEQTSRFTQGPPRLNRWQYVYDEKGRRTEETFLSDDAQSNTRVTIEFDDSGNRDITMIYDAEGKLRTRWDYRRDNQGRDMEVYSYDHNGGLRWHSTMAYESDSHGNWIKLKITREVYKDGQPQIEHEVQRRTITYY